ncbi:SET domain-containing protein 5 like [Verticillium longisporum]|nr:SET domain-containing protein 5 like [Verticillium longisporum]PNH33546.1 hypothetical protein BJF96_g3087 [Verticillium dahliae]PNH69436.1 hypothetical protein VD0002_g954 [Verticillium dahliae]PNH75246.1 hypothetical protein VD0001_g2315 [Verticillium dahliae]RBQ75673.1 hypothetical protein VDGD_03815 [Verticillium dahliae]
MSPAMTKKAQAVLALLAASAVGVDAHTHANTTVTDSLPRRCDANPAGPLVPNPRDWTCRAPIDHLSRAAALAVRSPWTHPPHCASSSLHDRYASLYCAFTKDDFQGTGGLVAFTSAKVAAEAHRSLEDRDPRWLRFPSRDAPLSSLSGSNKPRYALVDVGAKGLGLVAQEPIKKGDVLAREGPVMLKMVERPKEMDKGEAQAAQERAFLQLAKAEQLEILDLARNAGGHPIDDIVRTNSFEVKFQGVAHFALFKDISRINHACKPNAVTRWSQTKLQMEVIAYHDIKAGEEITISYAPMHLLSDDRRDMIISSWGFECKCPICTDEGEMYLSDMHRRQLDRIMEELAMPEVRTPALVSELVSEMEDMIDDEALDSQRGDLYGVVSRVWSEVGDYAKALRYAERGMGLHEYYRGIDDSSTWQAKRFVDFLKMKIGGRI